MEPVVFIVVILAIAVVSLCLWRWQIRRSEELIRQWAAMNGCRIVEQTHQWFRRGPFWWRTTKGQMVYRVIVEDRDGNIRRGWIRCGGWFLGLLSDDIAVEWES